MSDDKSARSNDEVALLLLLYELKRSGFHTQRLKLQKLVYLLDIFGTLLHKKPTSYIFHAYKYGPFSQEIFKDIERLVCIDAVKVKEIGNCWDDPNQDRSFEYEVDPTILSKVDLLSGVEEYDELRTCVEFVVQAAGCLNGQQIRKLVYCELNYIDAKKKGFGTTITPSYSRLTRFTDISRKACKEEFNLDLLDSEVLWLYLNFLREMGKQTPDSSYTNAGDT